MGSTSQTSDSLSNAARRDRVLRLAVGGVLLLLGAGLLVYGAAWHTRTLFIEQDRKVPAPPEPGGGGLLPPLGGAQPPAQPKMITVTESVPVSRHEPHLVFLATKGAMELLPSGAVRELKPQAFCPT